MNSEDVQGIYQTRSGVRRSSTLLSTDILKERRIHKKPQDDVKAQHFDYCEQ